MSASRDGEADPTAIVRSGLGTRIDSFVTTLAQLGYSGSVLVEAEDSVILSRGFGLANRRSGDPNRANVAFDIGSVAKTITALTALRLVGEGKISLDQPIGGYIRGLSVDKQVLTVRQLLDHTSGLPMYHDEDQERQSRTEAFANIIGKTLRWRPGEQYGYSNSGYTLLAMLIEDVAGEPFAAAVRRRVLLPASMISTGWEGDSVGRIVGAAHGYFRGRDRGAPASGAAATWGIIGAGGMYSTVDDLHRLSVALRSGMILDSATLATISPPAGADSDESLSDRMRGWTGWREDGHAFLEKGGNTGSGGFTSLLQVGPDARSTIVVLMNAEDGQYALGTATTVARALRSFVRGAPVGVLHDPVVHEPLRAKGTFADAAGGTVTFETLEDGVSMARVEGQSLLDSVLSHDDLRGAAAARWNAFSAEVVAAGLRGETPTAARASAAITRLSPRLARERASARLDAQVLGTVAEWVLPSAGYVTFVRVGAPETPRVIRLHWASDSTLRSIGGGIYPAPYLARVIRTQAGARFLSLGHGVFSAQLVGDPDRASELKLGSRVLRKP